MLSHGNKPDSALSTLEHPPGSYQGWVIRLAPRDLLRTMYLILRPKTGDFGDWRDVSGGIAAASYPHLEGTTDYPNSGSLNILSADGLLYIDPALPFAEKGLIKTIRRRAGNPRGTVHLGIGDDCAVLRIPRGHEALVTTDFSLEGVHFRREWHPPQSVGHRCLARGLSDIAAMGGIPVAAFLSLALPRKLPQRWVDEFISGLLRLASQYRVSLAGGDTAESRSGVLADVVVVGSIPRDKAILRSGAKPDDRIFVTGELGGAAAVLDKLFSGRKLRPRDHPRHFYPEPRLQVGRMLREKNLASAMIDLSDGLSTDLSHICEESRVGAEIIVKGLPAARLGGKPVAPQFVLHGGEDYELLFTAPAAKRIPSRIAGVPISQIGRIVRGKKIHVLNEDGTRTELRAEGWQHFQR